MLPEIRRWENTDVRPKGKLDPEDTRDPEHPRRRYQATLVRRSRNRCAYEAVAAGIPTVVIADEVGISVGAVWERVKRHCEYAGVEHPEPPAVFEQGHRAPGAGYRDLVADYGVLYDAWHEALTIARERADRTEIISRVAYYARQGGLPYQAIASALGFSVPGIRERIVNYARDTGNAPPRKRAAVTAHPGHRTKVQDGGAPPDWLMKELRSL